MADPLEVEGLGDLLARLERARAGLGDLTDAHRAMARTVADAAGSLVPRRTGHLAATAAPVATPDSWGVTYGAPYAAFVHWGTRYMRAHPWAAQAADRTEAEWLDQLTRHVQALLD